MVEINPKKAEIYEITRSHDLFDEENPRSLINIAPQVIKVGLNHTNIRHYLKYDEKKLEKMVKPTPTLNRLRQRFWNEFDLAQDQKRDMKEEHIWRGICSFSAYLDYMEKFKYMAWVLLPLPSYEDIIEESLTAGLNRIREIFDFPLYEKKVVKIDGKDQVRDVPNVKVADLMLKTVKMLDDRAKGGIIHRIESKVTNENKNLHLHAQVDKDMPMLMDEEIKKLEAKVQANKKKIVEAEVVDGPTTETIKT